MDDLGDGLQRPIRYGSTGKQHLKAATIAFMRELAFEHVEAQLVLLRNMRLAGNEAERRLGIDEPPDEPCARDPVDTWLASRQRVVERIDQTMTDFRAATTIDLAMLTVASRQLRALVES